MKIQTMFRKPQSKPIRLASPRMISLWSVRKYLSPQEPQHRNLSRPEGLQLHQAFLKSLNLWRKIFLHLNPPLRQSLKWLLHLRSRKSQREGARCLLTTINLWWVLRQSLPNPLLRRKRRKRKQNPKSLHWTCSHRARVLPNNRTRILRWLKLLKCQAGPASKAAVIQALQAQDLQAQAHQVAGRQVAAEVAPPEVDRIPKQARSLNPRLKPPSLSRNRSQLRKLEHHFLRVRLSWPLSQGLIWTKQWWPTRPIKHKRRNELFVSQNIIISII